MDQLKATEVAKVAANWWAALLRQDREQYGNARMSVVYQELFGDLPELTDDALAAFEQTLADLILVELGKEDFYGLDVSTDYEPQKLLGKAADAAGIDQERFPGKTKLIIESDLVRTSRGYGGKWQTIYTF